MLAFPSYPGATQLSTLRRVGCSNYFQNARVGLRATLSDGSVYTVTDHGSITLVAPANGASSVQLVSRQGVSYIVRPSSAGLVVVRGAFGVQNATSSLLVISAPANVTSVTLSLPSLGSAASGRLVAYQVEIHFDAAVLAATQCTGGDMGGFTCTINDPIDRAQLVGVDVSSTLQGSYVLLGTVSLSVRMSAVTLLSGEIVELVRHATGSSTQLSRVSMVPIAAGHGYAAVFGTDANGCLVGRWGDINSDCDLTAIDVLTAMLINIGVQNLADQCPWAQQQLDPTLDGERAGGTDVRFLQLVVGNKLRFVLNATSSFVGVQEGSRANLVVNVWLLDGQSS
ncbi:hypothetical protein Ctob_015209 [Chrysochromulina tobinii]|uniref:Uncharacterized protein n=1 Tax=Chrysochromulina tobinii TaxID=1460289 RepID=A0A0M0KBZ7_9EUKA|nr:hypothetical protein Ctob_015209 [Chrysochromulina tobinii]|eukprot:KOO35938.1 hypothetical protein Ctob_015209 [Chrysochromulina sp. CCMP291]